MNVKIRTPLKRDIVNVADQMREADIIECYAHETSPYEVLQYAFDQRTQPGHKCYTVVIDDDPCGMFGVGPNPESPEFGTIWLLGSEKVFDNPFAFARHSKDLIADLCKPFTACGNYIWEENHKAIAWLRWLGFRTTKETLNLGGKKFVFFVGPDKQEKI